VSQRRERPLPDCQELTVRYGGKLGLRVVVELDPAVCGVTAAMVVAEVAAAFEDTKPPAEEWN